MVGERKRWEVGRCWGEESFQKKEVLDRNPDKIWAHSWMATAGLEDAGSWEGRSWTKEVGPGVGWKEVEPGKTLLSRS